MPIETIIMQLAPEVRAEITIAVIREPHAPTPLEPDIYAVPSARELRDIANNLLVGKFDFLKPK